MKKTLEKATNAQIDSLYQLNTTIAKFASFLRVNAREERHQKAEETRERKTDQENKRIFRPYNFYVFSVMCLRCLYARLFNCCLVVMLGKG